MKFYTEIHRTCLFFVRLAAVYSENCVLVSQVAKHVVLCIFPTHYAKSQFQSVENYLSSDHD